MAQTFTKNIGRWVFPRTRKILQFPIFITTFERWKTSICWKCGEKRQNESQIFCHKCNIIQHPKPDDNYFKLFEIEEKFDVDHDHLKNKFRQLQSFLHPDKFSNRTNKEQLISAEYSALLNKAYSNLNTPLKRAEYLLELKGGLIAENQSIDDPEFLIEIMSLNEEVEEAGRNVEKLKELNLRNQKQIERICRLLNTSFKNNDIKNAKAATIKFKYFSTLGNRINGILRELGEAD